MTQTTTDSNPNLGRDTCRCEAPAPIQRAEWKGAAVTVCMRCGHGSLPV